MFMNILVAVDGSEHAIEAARSGGQGAFRHVARKLPIPETPKQDIDTEHPSGEPLYAIGDPTSDDAMTSVLKQMVKEAKTDGVPRVKSEIRQGEPSRTIVAMAGSPGTDAIGPDSRGPTAIEGGLLGSVSRMTASLASYTVVPVK